MNKHYKQKASNYLKDGHTLTGREAAMMWGNMRLAEYIRQLRHDDDLNIGDLGSPPGENYSTYVLYPGSYKELHGQKQGVNKTLKPRDRDLGLFSRWAKVLAGRTRK